jgi:hypothetical protein
MAKIVNIKSARSSQSDRPLFDVDAFLKTLRRFIKIYEPFNIFCSEPMAGLNTLSRYEILSRAICIRQHNYLLVVDDLCSSRNANYASMGLRPAFEELLWARYLGTLKAKLREELVDRLLFREIVCRYEAQSSFFGDGDTRRRGFPTSFIRELPRTHKENNKALEALKRELGWKARDLIPAPKELASIAGLSKEYQILYEGSSRFVHFSVVELLRMAWGDEDKTTVRIADVQRYLTHFVIYWSVFIYGYTIAAIPDEILPVTFEVDQMELGEILKDLHRYGVPPILTPEECNFR